MSHFTGDEVFRKRDDVLARVGLLCAMGAPFTVRPHHPENDGASRAGRRLHLVANPGTGGPDKIQGSI